MANEGQTNQPALIVARLVAMITGAAASVKAALGLATVTTVNAIARYADTTGGTKNSGVLIDDSNNVTGVAALTATGVVQGLSLKATDLTSGRVPFVTTGGALTDSSQLLFGTGSGLRVVRTTDGDRCYEAGDNNDSVDARFVVSIEATGAKISMGPGTGALDTNLYRSAASTLKTDGALLAPSTSAHQFGNVHIANNSLEERATNGDGGELAINYAGYLGGLTKYRNLVIYNGRGTYMASFEGLNNRLLMGVRIDTASGINFGDETLSKYDEGTWTPTIAGGTASGTASYSIQSATYTRIGRLVTVFFDVEWSAHTGTGDLRVSGLPFVAAASIRGSGAIGYASGMTDPIGLRVDPSTSYALIVKTPGTTIHAITAAGRLIASITYQV